MQLLNLSVVLNQSRDTGNKEGREKWKPLRRNDYINWKWIRRDLENGGTIRRKLEILVSCALTLIFIEFDMTEGRLGKISS